MTTTNRLLACAIASLALGLPLQAASVVINNDSFENPITGTYTVGVVTDWSIDSGTAGVWSPGAFPVGLTPLPDGSQSGYVGDAGTAGLNSISQDLGVGLLPNSTYTLSIYVGGRTDGYNPGTSYSVDLWAGATLLASVTPLTPPTGGWAQLTAGYASGAMPPAGNLIIAIGVNNATVGNNQLVFDKVGLTVVPEPQQFAIIAGLGLAAFVGYRRSRQ